jgi:hypothetical protein
MSSVFGLNASPHTATVLPRRLAAEVAVHQREQVALLRMFTASTASRMRGV